MDMALMVKKLAHNMVAVIKGVSNPTTTCRQGSVLHCGYAILIKNQQVQ